MLPCLSPLVRLASLVVLAAAPVPSPDWDALPNQVSGAALGATASGLDVAAAGAMPGTELQLRHVGTPGRPGTGALGLGAAAALGPVGLAGHASWASLPEPRGTRASLSASLALGPTLRLGLGVQRLRPLGLPMARAVVDAGVLLQPHRAVQLSLGLDALNAPSWPVRHHLRRTWRAGVGVRPWRGSAALTLALEGRVAMAAGGPSVPDARALLDVMPYDGLHVLGSWRYTPGAHVAWAGLAVDVGGLELMGAGRVHDPAAHTPASRLSAAATWRSQPASTVRLARHRHVHVAVHGGLRARRAGLVPSLEALPTLPARIAELAQRDDIARVTLDVGPIDGTLATVQELRAAIRALRRRGICTVAQLRAGDTRSYLVAAAAERVTMPAGASLDVRGFALSEAYLGEAMEALGVQLEVVGVGRYKTAPDTLTGAGPRPEATEVQQQLLAEAYATLQAALHARGLDADAAHRALMAGPITAQRAVGLGLIDALDPPLDPDAGVARRGVGEPMPGPLPDAAWGTGPSIAVIAISGTIAAEPGSGLPGAQVRHAQVLRALQQAQRRHEVVGAVVRIDSPGGDVDVSDQLYRAVHELARHKPVAVSMGDVAASGGYMAALGAPAIFAQPQTLTGSIGIFALRPSFAGLLPRLGVHVHTERVGERAGWDAWDQPLAPDDRARLQAHLEDLYAQFVARVAASRRLTLRRAGELAEGRVYSGAEAVQLGLVDGIGGLSEAVAWVRARARIDPDVQVRLDVPHVPVGLAGYVAGVRAVVRQGAGMALGPREDAPADWEEGGSAAPSLEAMAAAARARLEGLTRAPLALMPEGLGLSWR